MGGLSTRCNHYSKVLALCQTLFWSAFTFPTLSFIIDLIRRNPLRFLRSALQEGVELMDISYRWYNISCMALFPMIFAGLPSILLLIYGLSLHSTGSTTAASTLGTIAGVSYALYRYAQWREEYPTVDGVYKKANAFAVQTALLRTVLVVLAAVSLIGWSLSSGRYWMVTGGASLLLFIFAIRRYQSFKSEWARA